MIQTAGRLTLYGLIASVDADLRGLVRSEVLKEIAVSDALPTELYRKLQERAAKDGHTDELTFPDYLDFGDALATLRRHQAALPNPLVRLIRRHGEAFDKLIPVRNRVMHARPILLSDYPVAENVTKAIKDYPAAYFPFTREFDERVRHDPHHVFSIDASEITRAADRIPNNLPLPDYDETGFVGRDKEKEELKRLCSSQWPVITVVGEGGYGKTALSLQVAYDILDDDSTQFDAIVWTTAKRVRLTLNDIETIDEALTTSLGVIRAAASELSGAQLSDDPTTEVISYLNTFRILLIIDNLETILDPMLVGFLRQLNGNSKVLTTSRVGVGELSYSFPLAQMQLNDAVRLLRTLARARRLDDLAKSKASVLETYCRKMKLNAGFIKWFVTSVQYGKRPDEVLANPKVFLDFCVSHVFHHVSDDAKLVTRAMLAAPGKQSLALISYLTELTGDRLELALSSLLSANILKMSTSFGEDASETVYELSELPRLYILKNHPPPPEEDAEFKRRKREVVALYDRLQGEQGAHRFSLKTIACRSASDSVLARLLIGAIELLHRGQTDTAMEKVQQAITLDPSYSEAYRVEAYLYQTLDNNIAAEQSYQTAVELQPASAPLRFWYGSFLLRSLNDPKQAYQQFEAGRSVEPDNHRLTLQSGRCLLYLHDFEAAGELFLKVLNEPALPLMTGRMALDLYLQTQIRHGQRLSTEGRHDGALVLLASAIERLPSYPAAWMDQRVRGTLRHAESLVLELADDIGDHEAREQARQITSTIRNVQSDEELAPGDQVDLATRAELQTSTDEAGGVAIPQESLPGGWYRGRIKSVQFERKFGFIQTCDADVFFHFSRANKPEYIAVGANVTFQRFDHPDGRPTASKVKVDPPEAVISENSIMTGQIKNLTTSYGFIFGEDGHDYFFHKGTIQPPLAFKTLSVGDNVSFSAVRSPKGPVAIDIRPRD